jgi:hypothetical protein
MKKNSAVTIFSLGLLLAQLFLFLPLSAQKTPFASETAFGCIHNSETSEHAINTPPSWSKIESPSSPENVPVINTSFDQQEGDALLYETVAAWTGNQAGKAQVSLVIRVQNKQAVNITWNKVVLEYVQGGVTKSQPFPLSMNPIAPNAWQAWQNSRDYHQVGDVVYIDAPIPSAITIKLYFTNYSSPVTITKPLAPYTKTFGMPLRAFDLASNEVMEGGSTHGGGNQVFAYDLGVYGYDNGTWAATLPGTDGTQNAHFRIWGKPVYAMADGVVKGYVNDVPNNPQPGQQANWQVYTDGGGGNHFYIQHGENIALYAHMQKGSLNPALMQVGHVIKAGDFLGIAGNSGSSSGPHLHIHVRKETSIETGPFRPLLFNTGFAIAKSSFTSPVNNADWSSLKNHGLPGYAGTRAFIWPSSAKPFYSTTVYNGVFRSGTDGYALLVGATAAALQAQDAIYQGSGLRMTHIDVIKNGNNIEYSGVWRAGSGVSKIQPGTTWAAFTSEWSTLSGQGYRLLDLEVFTDLNGNLKYAGVYGAGTWGHQLIAGLNQADFNTKWSQFGAQGYKLVDVEVYKSGGTTLYAGVFKYGAGGYALWHAGSWSSFTSQWATLNSQGLRLVDLDTDGTGANTIYSGTFLAGNDGYALWESNWNSFYSYWEHVSSQGLRLVDINVRPATGPGLDDVAGDRENEDLLLVGPESPNQFEKVGDAVAVKVFPNPTSDVFTVTADADIQSWTLYNTIGSVVMRGTGAEYEKEAVIRVDALPIGFYQLSVCTAEGNVMRKVKVVHE